MSVTHNVMGSAAPAGVTLTSVAGIRTGVSFYVTDTTLDRCVGGRIYVPPAEAANLGGTVRLTMFASLTGLDLGATPDASQVVAIPAEGGWVEATWATPVAIAPNVPFLIGSEFTDRFLGGYLAAGAIASPTSPALFMSATAQRGWYKVGAGATTVSTDSGRWYATDAIVAEVDNTAPPALPTPVTVLGLTAEDLAYMRETQAEHRPTEATLTTRNETSDGMGGTTVADGPAQPIAIRVSQEDEVPEALADRYGVGVVSIVMDLVVVTSGDRITVSPQETYEVVSDGTVGVWTTAQKVWAVRTTWPTQGA